ncbi:MAG: zinc ribbon domain-containing protein [Phycisphaerae bacterium]|nr:zinc ribbon domain-containing protein [Phycisphaerae bacterium]
MLVTVMTAIVLFVIAFFLAFALFVLSRPTQGRHDQGPAKMCSRCHKANPSHARFCGQCGQELTDDGTRAP